MRLLWIGDDGIDGAQHARVAEQPEKRRVQAKLLHVLSKQKDNDLLRHSANTMFPRAGSESSRRSPSKLPENMSVFRTSSTKGASSWLNSSLRPGA